MAVTIQQMAGAYTQYVRQEIERIKKDINERRETLTQLEEHLMECLTTIDDKNKSKGQVIGPAPMNTSKVTNNDGTVTETISLPNPFEQLGIQ